MSLRITLAAAAVALSAGVAHAAQIITDTLTVTATVAPSCTLSGFTTYGFGNIGGTTAVITGAQATANVACSAGLTYSVQIVGNDATGDRTMTASGQTMTYSLEWFSNTLGWTKWTSTANPSGAGAGLTTNNSFFYRGVIPVQPTPGAGWTGSQFSETITIQVDG